MSSSDSSSVHKEECGLCGWGQTSKMCTSCAQKVEQANTDSLDSYNTSGSVVSSVDAVTDSLGCVDLSNDNDDDKLFQDPPPPKEDCQICLLPIPYTNGLCGVKTTYMPCCGKTLCYGCVLAAQDEIKKGNIKEWCPFCRVPIPSSNEEFVDRTKKRMKLNDAEAFYTLGIAYYNENWGLPQDMNKSFELYSQAAELGSVNAHYAFAIAYNYGQGVEVDEEKAIRHYKLAAIGGHELARSWSI